MLQEGRPIPELSILNRNPKVLHGSQFLHELVPKTPLSNEVAIDFLEDGSKRRRITYAALHAASDALAQRITQALAKSKNASRIIPVLLQQSPELYISLLAILKAGKAFCPIGLDTPKERLDFILKDVSASLILTDFIRKRNVASSANLQLLLVDDILFESSHVPCTITSIVNPSDLAYILYTSGSTGLPKAVGVSHRAVTQSLLAHDRHIPTFSRFLQFAAPTFDVSIFEIFFPLYRGHTLVGCTRSMLLDDLPGVIRIMEVDAAELTPTVASNLLKGRESVPGLKLLLTIGEMLTRHVIEEFGGSEAKESILWGMYGPTEAAIHCTLQPSFSSESLVGNIGFPLDTVSIFVAAPVTDGDQPANVEVLPFGEIGELVVGGPQLANGYLNRPELTAAAFVHDPAFGHLYRTGDKARIRPDGTLECLGRIVSGQVKLRGQRIELGEIEQVILKIDACHTAIVLVIEDSLVAFCATASQSVPGTIITETCRRWLPGYMVPAEIIFIEKMPQLPSGKIDKKRLSEQYQYQHQHPKDTPSPARPDDEVGVPVCHAFEEILGRGIALYADLGSIGLDSLQSIRIASSLREQGFDVSTIDILSATTLEDFIAICKKKGQNRTELTQDISVGEEITREILELRSYEAEILDVLPCTPLQEAMLAETNTKPSAYCNWIEVELSEPHSFSQIQRQLEILAGQNEIIRSGFCATTSGSGSFVQVVWKILKRSCIREVTSFSRKYSLGTVDSLLQPFTVQVIPSTTRPRLLFQIHHALYDGWSFDLLLRDLDRLLGDRRLEPRPQYREVVRYYHQLRNSEDLSSSIAYWTRLLEDYHPLPLPNFNGRVTLNETFRSVRGTSAVNTNSLYTRAAKLAINPQVFFQSAAAFVYSLYVGSSDVVIGTVTSGRTIPVNHVEEILGPCIASLPFRLDISDYSTIKDVLLRTQKLNRDMLHHCTLPLRDITRLCKLLPGERLFDILFIWQQSLVSSDNQRLGLRFVESEDDLEFRVTLEFEPHDDFILHRTTFDPSIITRKQVEYFLEQIDQVVNYFLSHTDGALAEVMQCFRTDLTSIANPKPDIQRIEHGPSHAVERRAIESPNKDALIVGAMNDGVMCVKERLTYAALNTRANQLAHALVEYGVGEDQLVCVLLEKSVDLYASILAVLKVGCGYLPIVPDTPPERTRRILEDAEVTLCISSSFAFPRDLQSFYIVLNVDTLDLAQFSDDNLQITYDGSHLAYAVFTSGSTGRPKGVLVTQDNLMSNLEFLSGLYPITPDSRLLQSCSQAFDVSVFEIFFSWYVGICLCTVTKDELFYNLEAAIDRLDITHLSLTPTVAALVDPDRVPKVKFLVTAGEAVTEQVKRRWSGRGLFQGYGPSETTNICTVNPYVKPDHLINNIGPPFSNTSAFVLQPDTTTVMPRGAVGELCFGGTQVFRGYLKMPKLNAEKIINHPQYGRIYRSGDLGLLLPDDTILFAGRLDDQVKIRGQRVELGEINSIILNHPDIRDCATVLLQHEKSQKLVTFWVPMKKSTTFFQPLPPAPFHPILSDCFESLAFQLPSYMIPTNLVPISRIPMTPQAKIDKRVLHATLESLSQNYLEAITSNLDTASNTENFSESEMRIAEVLIGVLDLSLKEIRRTSSFFNLGLDSISAISFAKSLHDAGFDYLPVSAILKNPTVERLSSIIAGGFQTNSHFEDDRTTTLSRVFTSDQLVYIRSRFRDCSAEVQKILPCTPLQEAMLSSGSSSSSSYYNMMAFRVNGRLEQLKQCCDLMVERHEILRTAFVSTDNSQYAFAQVVLAHEKVEWAKIQSSEQPTTFVRRTLPILLESHRPPVQFAIQNTGTCRRIIFCCHHAIYDGSAISALLSEIQQAYLGHEMPPPVPYERYLKHIISQDYQAADRFWTTALAGFEPTFFPKLTSKTQRPASQSFSFERKLQIPLSDILVFCQSASLSLISVIQASWAKLLHSLLGEDDLCFGNVVGGRTLSEPDLDRLVAPCFNTLPVRLDFDFQKSNSNLCQRLHSFYVNSLPFQLTPLRRIQSKALKDGGRLFDTLVILQQPGEPLDQSIWTLEEDSGDMDLPVVCEFFQDKEDDVARLILHYDTSLMLERDAKALAEIFDVSLQSLIRFPQSSAIDTVGCPTHLLAQSNMRFSAISPPHEGLLHSAFEQNAVVHSEIIALDFYHSTGEKTTMTFRELNAKANQLAHALIEQGIKQEDIIPVHIPKSPQFYISILGILKSGAAFAPVHPDLPEARKRFMLSELQPKLILSQASSLEWVQHVPVLSIESVAKFSVQNPAVQGILPRNLAYCLYTSGSTGVPKAVSMEHRSPIQTIESSRSLIPWNHKSRLLQYAAMTFDMCYYDCFLAWTFGFTLCASEQEIMLNNLSDIINVLDADLLDLTPSVAASVYRADVPSVKWLYCIGEAMTPEVAKEWGGACVNSYGPTEAAFCTTIFPVIQDVRTSIIGEPFPTTSFAVFPSQGDRPLPILGVGELCIGGAQLARGYYHKSELTDEKFVQKCGQRLYRSGDMVRMLSDGHFEFLGRADEQVKIRGLRVELGEISHVLQASDERISAVTTQMLKKETGKKDQLVAFLVHSGRLDEQVQAELKCKARQAATSQLPSYMVPQFVIAINQIPKSMAGKVDRKALTEIFRDSEEDVSAMQPEISSALSHEWTDTETRVRDIFSKLSNTSLEEISPWTSIYQLGLDSISAVQVATALRKQGFRANAADVMKYMNCKDLAVFLENTTSPKARRVKLFDYGAFETRHTAEIMKGCNIERVAVEAIRPCTPLQCGMLSQFIAREGAIYFNYLRLRLNDDVDIKQIEHAWSTTVQKHRMLRTGFAHIENAKTPFAMIHYTPNALHLPWEEVNGEESAIVEKWLEKSRIKAIQQLHLPPWRIRVVKEQNATYLDLALLHAIFDAQSLRLIFDDVAATYDDQELGTAVALEPVLDGILQLSSTKDVEHSSFWQELGAEAISSRFPNLYPLRYEPTPPMVHTKKSNKSIEELDLGCREANISLQAAGLASWATLLSSYIGERAVTFGVVLSGRDVEGAEAAVFPCITTVPFVCKVVDRKEQVLKEIMNLNTEVQRHQFTPLNEIQRLMGHTNEPLFDSIFAFQKVTQASGSSDIWSVVDESATIEYPVSIELEPKHGRLEYRLTFLPHLVPEEQAILILEQLDHLMEHHVFPKDGRSTNAERPPLLYSITPPKDPLIPAKARLLHEFVEHTAAQHPNRIALEFADFIQDGWYGGKSWTYRELDDQGNRIAQLLIQHGVNPGELVGVCFEKCPEASFAMLGILKAGCAFVALDPGAPDARKVFIIKDSGVKMVLSMTAQLANLAKSVEVPIRNLDELDWQSIELSKPYLKRQVNPQDRSYCLYTSGTTGTPKGCELTHENAVQALLSFQRLFAGHWNPKSRWLQFASFHFDVSVLEQYWSWSVGICVVSARRDLIFEDLARSIRTLNITHIDLTPSLARILHPDDVPSLCKGVFITGGESLKQEILDIWGPKGVIYNGYGPTEATIGVTMYTRVPANGKPSNIGPQFDNVGTYVLQLGSDVPVLRGGVGELCISGKLVGKGYLNRPDLTSERFPHLHRFNERVYRTGDLVRILHDGTFDFLGRADDQVKLRGQRLEIGEINAVIKQSGIILSDVATLVLKHPKQQKEQLVSFIVIGTKAKGEVNIVLERTIELDKARQACAEKLPPYMVPTHFVALTAMPLSPNNKAEARKLKEMYESLSVNDLQKLSVSQAKDEKWTKHEEDIRGILKDALEINDEKISKDASFFELGMDSISVIAVSKALKRAGFSRATAFVIMNNATIGRLAKVLSNKSSTSANRGSIIAAQQTITAIQHRHRRAVSETLFTDTRNIEALAPCTPLQQGMIARSLENENGLYFNTFCLELKLGSDATVEKLKNSWEFIFSARPILRTVFVNTEDGFVQAVLRKSRLCFDTVNIGNDATFDSCLETRRIEWVQRNRKDIKSPFEIIFFKSPTRQVMVIYIFHALYDGNSIGLVFKSIWNAYHGIENGDKNHPSFQSVLALGPLRAVDGAKEFWEKHLTDTNFVPFPSLIEKSTEAPTTVIREIQDLSNFETFRRKLNVTAQSIVQACWMSVLHRHVKSTLTIGIVVSGRSIDFDGADRVVGPMFNTIPYQSNPQHQKTWTSIIRNTHDFNVGTHPYQHTPLRDIMKWCKRGPGQPLFDTLFVYQVDDGDEEWKDNDVWKLMDGSAEADYPLAVEIEQKRDGILSITLVTQQHISDDQTSSRLLEQFENTLREALDNPENVTEISTGNDTHVRATPQKYQLPFSFSSDGATDFEWTKNATILRQEIASLANVDTSHISEVTSIFELGLDSIDSIKLSSKLKKRGIDLAVSGIMRSLTIVNMMQNATTDKKKWNERPSDMIYNWNKKGLERYLQRHGLSKGVDQVLPLTPLQEAMVAEMIASEYTRYYNHDVLRLAPDIDAGRLHKAWKTVVESSPILRTSFIQIDDPGISFSFAQVIHHSLHTFWTSIETEKEPDFLSIFENLRQDAVHCSTPAPLFHVRLVQSPSQAFIVLSIAHALYDGWSLGLLHDDVLQAYANNFRPRPRYENVLHGILTNSGPDATAFWRDYLSDAKLSAFPRQHNASDSAPQTVHRKEQTSRVALPDITSFARQNNTTLQTLGQTVYSLVLASYIHSLDVSFGSVLSGRDDHESSRLLFPTMNTVAIRTIIHGTRKELLQYVQDNFSNIKQWQHFPLRRALTQAAVQGNLFESLFIYQKSLESHGEGHQKLYESIEGRSDVEYPVCVEMEVVDRRLVWRCAVKDEVFDEAGTQELLDRLDHVVNEIISQPDAPSINFSVNGTSICGLPPFEENDAQSDEETVEGKTISRSGPELPTIKVIREVLASVSQTPEEEITEDITIFHIGLDSISAIKVSSLLRKRGVVLTVGEMLKAGTVERMAQIVAHSAPNTAYELNDINESLEKALAKSNHSEMLERIGVQTANIERILPATPGQEYMLSMWLNSRGAVFYPVFTYQLHGSISFDTLRKSWEVLVTANSILRTCLYTTKDKGTPYIQAVLPKAESIILDITNWDEKRTQDYLSTKAMEQPYVHLLVSRSKSVWVLKLKIHHALYDGVSLPILIQQLQDICNGADIPSPSNAFGEFIAKTSNSSVIQTRKAFWMNYLEGVSQQMLPQPASAASSKTEIFKPHLISDVTYLDTLSRKYGITIQSLFLAIYAKLYASLTSTPNTQDTIIGLYMANRSLPIANLAQAAIPTVNLIPLRVPTPLDKDILELAAQIQYDMQDISATIHSNVSLWEVSQWTGVRVDCFVNFLKLPEQLGDEGQNEQDIRLVQSSSEWESDVSRVLEIDNTGFERPLEAVYEDINMAYMHSIDIEATVRNRALNVGIFAPDEMLSLERGEKMMEDMKEGLLALRERMT